jgi:hypothetical protein
MNRFEKINLIIGAIASLGVIASFLFTIWLHRQQEETRLALSCEPALGEPSKIDKFMDSGYVIHYYILCSMANNSSHPVSVRNVNVTGNGALGNWPSGLWGSTGEGTLKGIASRIYIYDGSDKYTKALLPRIITPGDTVSFIVNGSLPIGNDLIAIINSECKQSMKHNISPSDFLRNCLNRSIFFDPFKDRSSKYDTIATNIEIVTTTGLRITDDNLLSILPITDSRK